MSLLSNSNIENNDQQSDMNKVEIDLIVEKLEKEFSNDNKSTLKIDNIQKIINKQNLKLILLKLSLKHDEDIVCYILNEFQITTSTNNSNKEKFYLDLYLSSIKLGQIKILDSLDKKEVNFQLMLDDEGNNGLILAVIFSDIRIVKFFLKTCPEMLEQPTKSGFSPLYISIYNNDNLMFFLLANNLPCPITNNDLGNSLCELAIRNENIEILSYLNPLLNKEKCAFEVNDSLLHFAVCQNNIDIFNMIVSLVKVYDYEIMPSKETPLHWAVMKGTYHIIKELLNLYKKNHIIVDKKNSLGITPFYLSNLRQDKNICELLFENGAVVNEMDNDGNTVAHITASLGDVKWMKYIIKKFNVNIFLKNNQGNTPFMMAILNENIKMIKHFIELFQYSKQTISSNINWRNNYGQTPLHAAVFVENIEIIKLLLSNKADISICDINDLTPYHYAYINEKENIIKAIHSILGLDESAFLK